MNVYSILNVLEIIFLFLALLIIIKYVLNEIKNGNFSWSHYGLFFLVFLSGWIIIELLDHQPSISLGPNEHFIDALFLIILSVWVNLRFFWAVKTTEVERL